MTRPTLEEIRERLVAAFPGAEIALRDDSEKHVGHPGAAGGAGHFHVRIVSERFVGLGTVPRHRLVYDAVHDWMPQRIHALAIEALTPTEKPSGSSADA
ncbi:MAG TPA: BolA/IbaG family iron-sulfur metabolism protein [Zeimonas sp.]|nr:BolA/IbaG family iron-sulfur metabolism protein [Zeimonas sp.]